jgi:hypothetical protein
MEIRLVNDMINSPETANVREQDRYRQLNRQS